MSGPVTDADSEVVARDAPPEVSVVEVTESRLGKVGSFSVRRALPRRSRRMVGPWCFIDHMGPSAISEDRGLDVAPHPHIGLQTVTWLVEGEAVHRDSLGTEQRIAPGELNLMTAGHGIAHSEEGTGRYCGQLHGAQLWIAQPSATRDGPAAFEHHALLETCDLGAAEATVLIGELGGVASPARRDTDHVGVDLALRPGTTTVPLRVDYEHALVVLIGAIRVEEKVVAPGHLAYLGSGRGELLLEANALARVLLLGGIPFDEPVLMWWNYVARTREEITRAHADWIAAADRFGHVNSRLPRTETGPLPWVR